MNELKITNKKIALCIPLTWNYVHTAFFDSFTVLEKQDCIYLRQGNGALADLRNSLVKTALSLGCSHILMCDVDQIYPVDTVSKLLSHKKPIVGGLVHRRYPPFEPLVFSGDVNNWVRINKWEEDELIKVDATGTGVLLFESWIFEKIPFPWFEFHKNPDENAGGIIGEDIWFCHLAKEAGIPIYVDTSLRIGHMSYLNVTAETHKLYMKYSKEDLV